MNCTNVFSALSQHMNSTQGRLTARRSDTILQRPRTAGGQARPAVRGRCRWTRRYLETLRKQCGREGVPAYMIEKGQSVPNPDSDFSKLFLDHVFSFFFQKEGEAEVEGKLFILPNRLLEFLISCEISYYPFVRKKTHDCMAVSTTAHVVFCFLMGKCIILRFNHRRNEAFHENIPKLFNMLSAFIVYWCNYLECVLFWAKKLGHISKFF